MSKTMTAKEARDAWANSRVNAFTDWLGQNAPITITPEPEPRPDFDNMNPWETLEWLGRSSYTNQELQSEYVNLIASVRGLAHKFADHKGLAK